MAGKLTLPPLRFFGTEFEYKQYYYKAYCRKPIITFDRILVYFGKKCFQHCFYESSRRNQIKDIFSKKRAERIDWIRATLENPNAELYQGWDKEKKRHDLNYRVAVVFQNYVVVIRVKKKSDKNLKANFVTAFIADNSIGKIRKSPIWKPLK